MYDVSFLVVQNAAHVEKSRVKGPTSAEAISDHSVQVQSVGWRVEVVLKAHYRAK